MEPPPKIAHLLSKTPAPTLRGLSGQLKKYPKLNHFSLCALGEVFFKETAERVKKKKNIIQWWKSGYKHQVGCIWGKRTKGKCSQSQQFRSHPVRVLCSFLNLVPELLACLRLAQGPGMASIPAGDSSPKIAL